VTCLLSAPRGCVLCRANASLASSFTTPPHFWPVFGTRAPRIASKMGL
jgi:hypothetical protein